MSIRRTSRRHEAGISQEESESYWAFRPGQHVMTVDGIPGTVTEVQDGPYPGTEQYLVTLDNGLGGGEYDASDLSDLGAGTTASTYEDAKQRFADNVMDEYNRLSAEAVGEEPVTAASDYPELAEILHTRPPLAHSEPLVMRASKTATESEAAKTDWTALHAFFACPACGFQGNTDPVTDLQTGQKIDICPQCGAKYDYEEVDANGWALDDPYRPENLTRAAAKVTETVGDSTKGEFTGPGIGDEVQVYAGGPWVKVIDTYEDAGYLTCSLEDGESVTYEIGSKATFRREADKKISSADEHVFFATAGLWDKVLTKGTDYLNTQMKPEYQVQDGTSYSYDWCRFRKNERCMFPKTLDAEGTKEAGYAVWIPEDRGLCPRNTWNEQQGCPVSEPGPHSGDPHARVDATVAWSAGGQRPFGPGGITNHTFANLTVEAGFEVTASWADVRNKAKRIRSEGGVRIISAPRPGDESLTVTAEINGDNHVYETTLLREPGRHNVASWRCGCAWASYSWGRSPAYKRFEGRMCSHALALQYEAQSQGMFGKTIVEQTDTPPWRVGNDPFEYVKPDRGYTRAASKDQPFRPVYDDALFADAPLTIIASSGGLTVTAAQQMMDFGGRLRALVNGTVKAIQSVVVDGPHAVAVTDDDQQVDASTVLYPSYHPTRGLTVTHTASISDVEDLHGEHEGHHTVQHVTMPSGDRYPYDRPEFDPSTWGGAQLILGDEDFLFEGDDGVEMEQGDPEGAASYAEAEKHDEPEPALPTTEGDEIEHDHDEAIAIEAFADPAVAPEMAEVVTASLAASPPKPGDPRLEWLMTGATTAPEAGDLDIAAGAKAYLAKQALKAFSPEEQKAIIEEGLDVQAANLGDLDIAGTHYEGLEAAFAAAEDEDDE
jgi:rubredoxin